MRHNEPVTDASLPPRGWYDDPADLHRERYWDGMAWTQRVRRKPAPVRRRGPGAVAESLLPTGSADGTPGAPGDPGTDPAGQRPRPQIVAKPRPAPPVTTPETTTVNLAGFGRRLGGAVIDYLIISVILAAVLLALGDFSQRLIAAWGDWVGAILDAARAGKLSVPATDSNFQSLLQQTTYIRAGVVFVYSTVFLGTWGATPGMRLVGVRVVAAPPLEAGRPPRSIPASALDAPCGWMRGVWRSLTWALLDSGISFFFLLQLLNASMILWHPRRQTIHDLVARTIVVEKPR